MTRRRILKLGESTDQIVVQTPQPKTPRADATIDYLSPSLTCLMWLAKTKLFFPKRHKVY